MTVRPNISVHFETDPSRSHEIVFSDFVRLPAQLARISIEPGRCLIVTDSNVGPLYGDALASSLTDNRWKPQVITLDAGEPTKSVDNVLKIVDAGLEAGLDRGSPVIGLGGGVVGDVAGFAAAILLRGVPLVHVPTSLLAQVDSSIGGKTGVNHYVGKNLIGSFHQPRLILVDHEVLATLPQDEWHGGLSEVVKTALLADPEFVAYLANHWAGLFARDAAVTGHVVHRCASIKAEIVMADERESGRRALLNLGHTFGHAIEKVAGYEAVTHGVAVAAGMRAAIELSTSRYPDIDFAAARRLVDGLPASPVLPNLSLDDLVEATLSDKKRSRGKVRFVLLEYPGSAVVVDDVTEDEIRSGFAFALGPFESR